VNNKQVIVARGKQFLLRRTDILKISLQVSRTEVSKFAYPPYKSELMFLAMHKQKRIDVNCVT
jgi:hypothetical protein